jgi:DNA polymerase-4
MHSWGIFNGDQLKQQSLEFLNANFGKSGEHYFNIVRGIQHSAVKPERERKSVGAERTYSENLIGHEAIIEKLKEIGSVIEKRLKASKVKGRTITLKVKFSDFQQITRSRTIEYLTDEYATIFVIIEELIQAEDFKKSVRLLGISVSNFYEEKAEIKPLKERQLKLDF